MPRFEYEHPGDIDGEPALVAEQSVAQVANIVDFLTEALDAVGIQVRNAVMQEAIEAETGDPTEAWEDSDVAGELVRAKGALGTTAKLIARLQESVRVT